MNTKITAPVKIIDIDRTLKKGIKFLTSIQEKNGCWKGDYGGPMFLLPMYIGTCYITRQKITGKEREGFIEYYKNVQNSDGSIGLHAEDTGSMFTSVLAYAALRMLDVSRNEAWLVKMRIWILANGGAIGSASWGKFFLCLLNLYPYEGLNPLLPELWNLPYFLPFHPGRMWCHARQVYLPMAYLYGIKAVIPEDKIIHEIREDIYNVPYNEINFKNHKDTISEADNYRPYSSLLRIVNKIMVFYEKFHSKNFRKKSLKTVFDHLLYEDKATNYIDIGPVNSILNTIVHYFVDKEGDNFTKSFSALKIYLFEGHDGIKMNGYNSTALWDTAFAVQSIIASGLQRDAAKSIEKGYEYIKKNQVIENVPDNKKYYRHLSRGGWPFSDREHGWPITDCTAEGFKSAILVHDFIEKRDRIPDDLLKESIELILSFQNSDGGWATYEKRRAGYWLELLNPSSVFGDIMIDYPYVECTSACIQALAKAQKMYGGALKEEIERSIKKGVNFIKSKQRSDGSFEGSWAVCFTYGTWFGVWGLLEGGVSETAPEIKKASEFLIKHQNEDGGWGESSLSSRLGRWIYHERSQVVNTSWALLALVRAGMAHSQAAEKAVKFIIKTQCKHGDWPRESLVGIFNKTALINYENYRRYFPIWALGLYKQSKMSLF